MMAARPAGNSARFRQRESTEYPEATFSGSREFHESSAIRTFWMAVSRVNGGRGGRLMEAELACGVGSVFVVVSVMMGMKSSFAEASAASVPIHCATRPSGINEFLTAMGDGSVLGASP